MENEKNIQTLEEPLLFYCSTAFNFGVGSKSIKSPKYLYKSFSPFSSNKKITFSNTIMIPLIKSEESRDTDKNSIDYKNEKSKNYTRMKTDSSKDEKYCLDDKKPVTKIIIENESNNEESFKEDEKNNKEENNNLELNPFFLGSKLSYDDKMFKSNRESEINKTEIMKKRTEDKSHVFKKLYKNACNKFNNEQKKKNNIRIKKKKSLTLTAIKRIKNSEKPYARNSAKKDKLRLSIGSSEEKNSIKTNKNSKSKKKEKNSDNCLILDIKNNIKDLIKDNNIKRKNKRRATELTIRDSNNMIIGNNIKIYKSSLFNKKSSLKLKKRISSKEYIKNYDDETEKENILNEKKKKKYLANSLKILDVNDKNKKEDSNKFLRVFEEKKIKRSSDKLKEVFPNFESRNDKPNRKKISKSIYTPKNKNINFNEIGLNNKKKPKNSKIKRKADTKKLDFESALKNNNNLANTQFNLFSPDKFTNTEFCGSDFCEYTLDCMDLILNQNKSVKQEKPKVCFNFPSPQKGKLKKKIALFDLDETLVHCTGDINLKKEEYQHSIQISLPNNQEVKVGINIRPFWRKTLNLVKKYYYIVVFTASHQSYADAVLNFMDPQNKYFKYRLYRNNCSLVDVDGAKFYVKDLDIFDEHYDLKDIVIIDNSVLSFIYHLENGIPIVPYYNDDKFGSLYIVGLYLEHIHKEGDLRIANKKYINLESFLNEARTRNQDDDSINEEPLDSVNNTKDIKNDSSTKNDEPIIIKNGSEDTFNSEEEEKEKSDNEQKQPSFPKENKTQCKLMRLSKLFNMYYEMDEKCSSSKKKNVIIEEESNKSSLSNEEIGIDVDNNNDKGESFFKRKHFSAKFEIKKYINRKKSNKTCRDYLDLKMIRANFYQKFSNEVNSLAKEL